jgi:hypothetical protein
MADSDSEEQAALDLSTARADIVRDWQARIVAAFEDHERATNARRRRAIAAYRARARDHA